MNSIIFKYICLVLVGPISLFFACNSLDHSKKETFQSSSTKTLSEEYLQSPQYQSLNYIYYKNTPSPQHVTKDELADAFEYMKNSGKQQKILRTLYGDSMELIALAIRDTDNDSIPDYRISTLYGTEYYRGCLLYTSPSPRDRG